MKKSNHLSSANFNKENRENDRHNRQFIDDQYEGFDMTNHFWKMAIPFGGHESSALSLIFFKTIAVASPGFTTTANGWVSFL